MTARLQSRCVSAEAEIKAWDELVSIQYSVIQFRTLKIIFKYLQDFINSLSNGAYYELQH